jgi:hypothetical protein
MEARMEALTTHLSGLAVFQRLFEFGFGLGGVAIFLCGRRGGSIYILSVLSVGCLSVSRGRRRVDDLGLLRRRCRLLRGRRRLRRLGQRGRSGRWRSRGSNSGRRGRSRRWGNSGRRGTFGLGDGVDGQAHERTLKFGSGQGSGMRGEFEDPASEWEEFDRGARRVAASCTGTAHGSRS